MTINEILQIFWCNMRIFQLVERRMVVQYAYISARRKANGILRIALKNFPTDCSSLMSPS